MVWADSSCLPANMRLQRSTLQSITFELRQQSIGTLRLGRGSWGTHILMTEILRIIISEYLSYAVESVESAGSAESYSLLASNQMDVNAELWEAAAQDMHERYVMQDATVINAGRLAYAPYTRSGLYVRPSSADRASILSTGRFYGAMENVVLPKLSTTENTLQRCLNTVGTSLDADDGRCTIDIVNSRRCVASGSSSATSKNANSTDLCKPIIKETRRYDEGIVEGMILQGDLPLEIVYVGVGGTEKMLSSTDETIMFHWWEPSALISDGGMYIRMSFDPAVACEPRNSVGQGYVGALYPDQAVCDWTLGQPHKAYSRQLLARGGRDITTLIDGLNMPTVELIGLLGRGNGTNGTEQVACEWVRNNYEVWQSWLQSSDRWPLDAAMHTGSVLYQRLLSSWILWLSCACLLLQTMWLCLPLCLRKRNGMPTPAETWEQWSNYPGLAYRVWRALMRIFCFCTRCAAKKSKEVAATAVLSPRLSEGSKRISDFVPDHIESRLGAASRRAGRLVDSALYGKKSADVSAWERKREARLEKQSGEQLMHGVQWGMRRLWGQEGGTLQLSIIRDESVASKSVKLRVWGSDLTAKHLCQRTLAEIGVREVHMKKGSTHIEFALPLAQVSSGSLNLDKGVWQPELSFALHLDILDDEGSKRCNVPLGEAHTCTITIVDTDDWPVSGASKMSGQDIFRKFVWQIWRDNTETELWWLLGTLLRAAHGYILDPLLLKWLIDFAIAEGDAETGLQIALAKAVFLFVDQYTHFHYNSDLGISTKSPPQWMLYKWQSLPLEEQLNHERNTQFRTLMRRIDSEFSSRGYSTFCTAFGLVVNIIFTFIATYLLAPDNAIYLYAVYAVAFAIIFLVVGRTVPKEVASINDGFWNMNNKYQGQVHFLFSEMVAIASSGQAQHLSESAISTHAERSAANFSMYYIGLTQAQYTNWIMMSMLVVLYAGAAWLVEFGVFTQGELIAICGSITGACGNIVALCSMRDQFKVAVDLVDDLSQLLSSAKGIGTRRVAHSQRVMHLLGSGGPGTQHLCDQMSLHMVDYTTHEIDALLGSGTGLQDTEGTIPLGDLYGFAEMWDTPDQQRVSARMSILMDLLAGLRTPIDGEVLMPPHVDVRVVPRDPGVIENDTVFNNLIFGLPLGTNWGEDEVFVQQVTAICRKLHMHPSLFGKHMQVLPMMQVSMFAAAQERFLVSLLRALLPLPDVLLINDLGLLTHAQAQAVHTILRRFVDGHDLEGIAAGEEPPQPDCPPRTVVWVAPPATLAACGVSRLVNLTPDATCMLTIMDASMLPSSSPTPQRERPLSSHSPQPAMVTDDATAADAETAPTRHGLLPPLSRELLPQLAREGATARLPPSLLQAAQSPPEDTTVCAPSDFECVVDTPGDSQASVTPRAGAQAEAVAAPRPAAGAILAVADFAAKGNRRRRWTAKVASDQPAEASPSQ